MLPNILTILFFSAFPFFASPQNISSYQRTAYDTLSTHRQFSGERLQLLFPTPTVAFSPTATPTILSTNTPIPVVLTPTPTPVTTNLSDEQNYIMKKINGYRISKGLSSL